VRHGPYGADDPRTRWYEHYRAARIVAHHQPAHDPHFYAETPGAAILFSLGVWTVLVYVGSLIARAVF